MSHNYCLLSESRLVYNLVLKELLTCNIKSEKHFIPTNLVLIKNWDGVGLWAHTDTLAESDLSGYCPLDQERQSRATTRCTGMIQQILRERQKDKEKQSSAFTVVQLHLHFFIWTLQYTHLYTREHTLNCHIPNNGMRKKKMHRRPKPQESW